MPLPLLVAAWAIGAAASGGAGSGVAGGLKMRRAKREVEEKREQLERAESSTAMKRGNCERTFVGLGEAKIRAMEQGLIPFAAAFSRLQNVDLQANVGVDGAPEIDHVRVTDAGRLTLSTMDAIGGAAAAGAAGAAASGAAVASVTALASASTGAAISSLSGAAASNATLAFLGGGALSAGGGGVAAGTMVLGGVAAAPVMLVGGVFLYKKGSEAMAKAATFGTDVDAALAKHREAQAVLTAAERLATGVRRLLDRLVPALAHGTGWLEMTVDAEPDWTALDNKSQERIRSLAVTAVAVSDLVHTPIVDENGALTKAIHAAYARGKVVAGGVAA